MEEPLDARSVHTSSLLSPRFIHGLGRQELLSCGGLLLPDLSRLVLPPHLCTPCKVMGRESLRGLSLFSLAPPASSLHALQGGEAGESSEFRSVRIPPWLPDLRLGKPGRCFEPLLGMALVIGLVAPAVRARLSGRDAVGVDCLASCFPLRGHGAVAGSLRTASGFIAFALVASVWPVAVF